MFSFSFVRFIVKACVTILAISASANASIHDIRSLHSFSGNLNSYWSSQPPLGANGFTPSYASAVLPDSSLSQCVNLGAFNSSQSLVLNNWAAANGGAGINGGPTATRTNQWTMVMDIKPLFAAGTQWLSLLQTNTANNDDGDIFINADGRLFINGYVGTAGTIVANTWQRLAFVCSNDGNGGPTSITAYRNGVLMGTSTTQALDGRFSIGGAAFLLSDDNGETQVTSLSTFGFWTEALTGTQITSMGGPKGTTPELQWGSMPGSSARPGLTGKLKFGTFELDLPLNGFQLGSGNVQLSPGIATVPGQTSYYLTGTHAVKLAANGDLIFTGTAAYPAATNGGVIRVNNVSVNPGGVTLTQSGATASAYSVTLPIGMGVNNNPGSRRLKQTAQLGAKILTNTMMPSGIQQLPPEAFNYASGDRLYVSLESMPLRYNVSRLDWSPSTGAFQIPSPSAVKFDRSYERTVNNEWNAIGGVAGDPRPSNDDYFAAATTIGDILVDCNTDGIARIRQMSQGFAGGSSNSFTAHFPYGLSVSWLNTGTSSLTYSASELTTNSYLFEGLTTSLNVARDCPDAGCPLASQAGPKTYSFTPPHHWTFTRDGGLHAPVNMNATVEWGAIDGTTFAHKITTPFGLGGVHIPGQCLRSTDVSSIPLQDRPAALLLSGNGNGTVPNSVMERPGTSSYYTGAADYAGLNLRVASDGAAEATSTLAGTPVTYLLRSRSKYLLRQAGITGIHEAVTEDLPPNTSYAIYTVLAGYATGLSDIRLSFLDSENLESGINGSFNLPSPALLTDLAVKRIRFGCRGELLGADFETSTPMTLGYWGCVLIPHAMHFALPDTPCASPSTSTLVLGAEVKLPALSDQSFNGNIGFKSNGHTVTPADNLILANGEKVTSRLRPPSQLAIKGPGSLTYPFTPIGTGAYLNEFTSTAPPGFVALTGEMDVPFFRNLRCLINAKSSAGATASSTVEVYASDDSTFNFYGATDPDSGNLGKKASGVMPDPIARRELWDLIKLKLPVKWTNLRRFQGTPVTDNLVLFKLQQSCTSLGPEAAEIDFGASVSPLSKAISAATLLDALGADTNGLLARIQSQTGSTALAQAVTSMKQVDLLGGDSLKELLGPSLEGSLDVAAETLYNQLKTRYNTVGSQNYRGNPGLTDTFFNDAATAAAGKVTALSTNGWPAAVQTKLDSAIGVCDQLKTLTSDSTKILGIAKAILNNPSSPQPTLAKIEQTIADLDAAITDVKTRLTETRNAFGAGGVFQTQLSASLGNTSLIQPWARAAIEQLQEDWVSGLDDPTGAGFFTSARLPEFTIAFKKAISAGFAGSSTEQNLRTALQSILTDPIYQLKNCLDGVVQAANAAVQNAVALPSSPVDTLGGIADVFQGANLVGYARINGDSLSELRLDADLTLKVPDDLTFRAWFVIRDMDGSVPGDAALAAGGVKSEVTVGATAPLSFIGQEITASVEARVGIGDSGPVLVAGSIGMVGEFNLQSIIVRNAQFGVAMGEPEAYIYAKAAGELNAAAFAMSAEAAMFFGKTCRLDPITKVNPNITQLLTNLGLANPAALDPLYGAYTYAYGDFSVLSLLGIPPSCLLDLRVGGGQGFYLFYRDSAAALGGLQFTYGVRGQALCLLDVSGRLDGYIAAAVSTSNVSLSGLSAAGRLVATLSGEIGIDPFSYDWEKNFAVDIIYNPQNNPKVDWSIDF